MKTNKITKIIVALMAIVIFSSLTVTAFADTGSNLLPEGTAFKKDSKGRGKYQNGDTTDSGRLPQNLTDEEMLEFLKNYFTGQEPSGSSTRQDRKQKSHADRFEDWFEDHIDSREHFIDFSQLPQNPTEEEMVEFFNNYFTGQEPSRGSCSKQDKNQKSRADWFEDWFEKRIESRSRYVDFSQLPENPTDEEMIEFFRKNFTGEITREESQDQKPVTKGKDIEPNPETTEPVTDVTTETPIEQDITETPPAEEQPEEGTKDIA